MTAPGVTIWLTGLSGSGKTTIGSALSRRLSQLGVGSKLLDGDALREGLNRDLGFSREDRAENVRRIGEVALLFTNAGHVAIVSAISPYASDRQMVRLRHESTGCRFIEVYVATPLATCIKRDPKRLYAMATAGQIENFSGVSDPYEAPETPDVLLASGALSVDECVAGLMRQFEGLSVTSAAGVR